MTLATIHKLIRSRVRDFCVFWWIVHLLVGELAQKTQLIGVVWIPIVLLFLVGIVSLWIPGGDKSFGWTFVFVGVFTAGLVLLLTYPLYYEITSSSLNVRCGVLIRKAIPLSQITNAYPNRNSASAPAWSLDRIRINYQNEKGSSFIHISPTDKLGFLRELADKQVNDPPKHTKIADSASY